MTKILVTGGAGFIGMHLCIRLKELGFTPVILDNFSSSSAKANKSLIKKLGFRVIEYDLTSPITSLEDTDFDLIFHLAANCSTSRSIAEPYTDFLRNAVASLNILEFSRNCGKIPVIYTSTCKVYTTQMNTLPISEKKTRYILSPESYIDEIFPIDGKDHYAHAPYGCSKYVGDLYCQEYAHTFGVPTIVNRMSTVFGLRQFGSEESGWVYHFIAAKKRSTPITIFGSGKQVRDCLWVEDLIDLFLVEANKIRTLHHRIYNIGGGERNSLSLIELVDFLDKKPGKKLTITFEKERSADLKVYITNINKVKEELGWKPKTSVFTGVDRIYEEVTL